MDLYAEIDEWSLLALTFYSMETAEADYSK